MRQTAAYAAFARLLIVALLFVIAFAEQATAQSKLKSGPSLSSLPCRKGDSFFTHMPTQLGALSAIVPLGNVNPAAHTLPTRHIYVYPKMATPDDVSTAITIPVRAPGRLEIVVIEFHPDSLDWSLHLKPCKDISLYFFHVQTLVPKIAAAVGNIADGGVKLTDFTAKPVSIMVTPGQLLGHAKIFDMGIHDFRKSPLPFVNPARYAVDFPKLFAAFPGLAADPIAQKLAKLIVPQAVFNRCPIDYFRPKLRSALEARLADYDGEPPASGKPLCYSHMQDVPGTAQGNWFSDINPNHDALFAEERAVALITWNVNPTVQLFSLNENVPGFTSGLLEAAAQPNDVNSAFEFPVREGPQRINRRFAEIKDDAIYCYDIVRVQRGGPRLEAVILIAVSDGPGGPRSKLTLELVKAAGCPAVKEPWTFSGQAATYYR
jgi:hypothetical protein